MPEPQARTTQLLLESADARHRIARSIGTAMKVSSYFK